MKLSQLYSEHIYLTNSHTAKRSKRWLIGSWICLSDLRKVAEKLHSSNCDDTTQKQDKSHERSPCSPHALTTARPYTADLLLVEVVKMHIFLSSLTALSADSFFVYIYKELDQNALLVYRSHSFYLEIMIQKKKKKKLAPGSVIWYHLQFAVCFSVKSDYATVMKRWKGQCDGYVNAVLENGVHFIQQN